MNYYEKIMNYLEENCEEKEVMEVKKILEMLDRKEIPLFYSQSFLNSFNVFLIRELIIQKQGFALISKDWVKSLANWLKGKRVLEVMSGFGALAYALREEGVDLIATDNFSWSENNKRYKWEEDFCWTHIHKIDAIEAVKKYGNDIDVVLICWPYMDDTAYRVLQTIRKINPNLVLIYIGEDMGGRTADDNFHENIIQIDDPIFHDINLIYPRWRGVYDFIGLYK